MRLVLVTDAKGVPVAYDLLAPGEGEREPLYRLAQAHPYTALFAEKKFWGAEHERTLGLIGVELITPERHRLAERPPAQVVKASIRLVIESGFSNLKGQNRLGRHLAKTLPSLVQRIAQRLLALTLGIFCNLLVGRPARALAAYGGR